MEREQILNIIKSTESPLKRQLLMVALVTRLLEEKGKGSPIIIGGCALSYYSREVYFTADIDPIPLSFFFLHPFSRHGNKDHRGDICCFNSSGPFDNLF
jgi:hypothetical protein